MKSSIRHLDQRFSVLRALAKSERPQKGWVRAIRDALGMTTAQFARRLNIAQPSAVELEQSEAGSSITLRTLERAAEALGCRVVYALIPEKPLAETIRDRARLVAARKVAAVEHTMRLEDQAVHGKKAHDELLRQLIEDLMKKPARLWDDALG
jgi:predicted DNA-binding mobile mystery protein A